MLHHGAILVYMKISNIKGNTGEKGKSITGKTGKKGDKGEKGVTPPPPNLKEIAELVELPPPLEPIPPPTPDETINTINQDTDKKIKLERIEGLPEALQKKGQGVIVGGGGTGGGRVVKVHDLSDSLDGTTKTFTMPAFWRILLVQSSSFPYGSAQKDIHWTEDADASTITFTDAIKANRQLKAGQSLLVQYSEA